MPVLKIREIIRLVPITPIPQMPHFIRGVINLRGKIVPIVDFRALLNLPSAAATERTCIVVANILTAANCPIQLGLVVDAVEEVLSIAAADIEEPPDFGGMMATEFLLGIAKINRRVTTLLNLDRILTGIDFKQMTDHLQVDINQCKL